MLEDGDRRICFLPTPNVLAKQQWVLDMGGVSTVHDKIISEIKDFCYYLATEVDALTPGEYMVPPESKSKMALIADSMYAAKRIAFAMQHCMIDYLKELCIDYDQDETLNALKSCRLTEQTLEPLYLNMTDMQGELRSLNKAIRAAGVHTRGKDNPEYLIFPDNPFEAE